MIVGFILLLFSYSVFNGKVVLLGMALCFIGGILFNDDVDKKEHKQMESDHCVYTGNVRAEPKEEYEWVGKILTTKTVIHTYYKYKCDNNVYREYEFVK